VPGIWLHPRPRQHLQPGRSRAGRPCPGIDDRVGRGAARVGGEQPDPARGIADEPRGVDLHVAQLPGRGQRDDRVIVARAAPPGVLPPLPHAGGPAGQDQVARRGVKGVGAAGHPAAVLRGREVDDAGQEPGIGHRGAVHPEPGHSAVRIDRQPDVGPPRPLARHRVDVDRVALGVGPGDQRVPGHRGQLVRRRVALGSHRLHRHLWRVVAAEERGVDDHAVHDARDPEPHDRVVVTRLAAAAGLPAVVDLPAVPERPGREHRRLRPDQVLLLREQLVAGGDHAAAEPPRREVGQVGDVGPGLAHAGSAPRASSRPKARSPVTGAPRSHVRRTTPCSRWPA
jgi:hypothetical protein